MGKSTLVNALLNDERMLTGPEAGVTRDAITSEWEWKGRKINLVDTAGLRRQSRVEDSLEKMSAASTKHAAYMAQDCGSGFGCRCGSRQTGFDDSPRGY